jgi:hypothetical protein
MAFMQKRAAAADQAQSTVHRQVLQEEAATEAPARSVQDAFARRAPEAQRGQSGNQYSRNPSTQGNQGTAPPRAGGHLQASAPMRAEALLRAVSGEAGWTIEQVERAKEFLRTQPEEGLARLQKYYDDKIRPKLSRTPNIDEWVETNPNTVAFQFEAQDGQIKGQAFPNGSVQAERYALYHGIRMRSVDASESPFPPPSELFRIDAEVDVARTEDAFGATGTSPEAAAGESDPNGVGQPEEAGPAPARRLHP